MHLTTQFAAGFFIGMVTAAVIYVIDWYWHVKIQPKRASKKALEGEYPSDRTLAAALKEKEQRGRSRERRNPSPPDEGDQIEPEASVPPPAGGDALPAPEEPATAHIEEQSHPRTSDFPATVEHPAPSTAVIDTRQPPPPLPTYTGPERRFSSDNPYPELRRRAADREAYEASLAAQPPLSPPSDPPRRTRAEERRLREGQTTQSDHTDTDPE